MADSISPEIHDVLIVGSGPAGYTAAIYAARANLKPVVLAGSVTAGGELMNTTEVENFPGFAQSVMGPELMMTMEQQALRFGADIRREDVTELLLDQPIKRATLGTGELLRARTVVLATGSAYRELNVPGEKEFTGHGVSWCATCDGFFFTGRSVAVVGGGDSAMEEALFLTKFADQVVVLHRRDQLRASRIMADRALANEKIRFLWNTEVISINGSDAVESLHLRDTVTGEESRLEVAGVFVAIGHDPRVDLVADQLKLTPNGTVWVDERSSRTSLPGVFAAGDVLDTTYRQAITAAGSGCAAAIDVEHWLSALGDPHAGAASDDLSVAVIQSAG